MPGFSTFNPDIAVSWRYNTILEFNIIIIKMSVFFMAERDIERRNEAKKIERR